MVHILVLLRYGKYQLDKIVVELVVFNNIVYHNAYKIILMLIVIVIKYINNKLKFNKMSNRIITKIILINTIIVIINTIKRINNIDNCYKNR